MFGSIGTPSLRQRVEIDVAAKTAASTSSEPSGRPSASLARYMSPVDWDSRCSEYVDERQHPHRVGHSPHDAFELPRRVVRRGSGVQRIQSCHRPARATMPIGSETQPGVAGRAIRVRHCVRNRATATRPVSNQPRNGDDNDDGGDVAGPVRQRQRVPESCGIGQRDLDVEHGQRQAGESGLEAVDPAQQHLQCHHPGQCRHAEARGQQDTAGRHVSRATPTWRTGSGHAIDAAVAHATSRPANVHRSDAGLSLVELRERQMSAARMPARTMKPMI